MDTKVEVLMSTYNGANYVARQIDSILSQKNVNIHLTIRDDGSSDETIEIIHRYENKFPTKIKVIIGENIGYKRSFLSLLSLAETADYYAFSDQDDIWESKKLSVAISMIENMECVLYTSNLDIYSYDLKKLYTTTFSQKRSSIYSEFTRHRFAGCTYVFDNKLMNIVSLFSNLNLPAKKMPSHDSLVSCCAYACGNVIVDECAKIKHIRYAHSVTAGGNRLWKRIKVEWVNLFLPIKSNIATLILNTIRCHIREENIPFLEQVSSYQHSFTNWFALLTNRKMTSGIFIVDLKCKLQILICRY